MKISIHDVRETPDNMLWSLCVYGEPKAHVQEWVDYHGFATEKSGEFTNISVPHEVLLLDLFLPEREWRVVDGFSPNLNKQLHLGHLSNLIIAKALQSLDVGWLHVSLLGDTLEGVNVDQNLMKNKFLRLCSEFGYRVDAIEYASRMVVKDTPLHDGEGEYEGTKYFKVGEERVVGIKSDGSTTYFYQDVASAEQRSDRLYLTGSEQKNHFQLLKKLFPDISHLPLGLVQVSGKKMSSRTGEVLFVDDVFSILCEELGDDRKLAWNVIAGCILQSEPGRNKNINLDTIKDVKKSLGLYLSYTLARMHGAGLELPEDAGLEILELRYKLFLSRASLKPNILFRGLVRLARRINGLYETHQIRGNAKNQQMFTELASSLKQGMKCLGMFDIEKV